MVGLRTTYQISNKLKVQLRYPEKYHIISTYLLDQKKIVDTIAVVGASISIDDQIEAILDDLPDEYDSFITFVTSRVDPYRVDDIEALLLAQEERFDKHRLLNSSIVQAHFSTASWQPQTLHQPNHG